MITIKKNPHSTTPKVSANHLPCQIHHDGTTNARDLWRPQLHTTITTTDTHSTNNHSSQTREGKEEQAEYGSKKEHISHFRGRRLLGREVKVPGGFVGVVLQEKDVQSTPTGSAVPNAEDDNNNNEDDGEEEEGENDMGPAREFHTVATFSSVMVWGHDEVVDEMGGKGDGGVGLVTGLEEWVAWGGRVHDY